MSFAAVAVVVKDVKVDIPVSVIIPARNEERNLPQCLAALSRFAEVVVVDSGSVDRTRQIARDAGAEVVDFKWNGRYPKKRNWMLLNQNLRNDWILFLDADEVVNDDFCKELMMAISSGQHSGYWLNYTNYFLGKELRYGVRQRKLALLKSGAGLYERIEEDRWSSLDMEVHEHPIINGSVGEIFTRIDHRDFRGLDKFLARHIDYASWEAHRYRALTREAGAAAAHLTRRQRFKYKNIERWWYPLFYFGLSYVVKGGFLDGGVGLSYAFYKAWYFQTVRLMIREARECEPALS